MNDRYLFRAKRIDNGEFVEGFLTIMWGQLHIINSKDENTAYPIDESTICQCTGLNDENGNQVFENDIMCAHLDDSFPEDITYARVIWGDSGYCLKEKGSIDINPLEIIDMEYFEVCGNIFDNPELL